MIRRPPRSTLSSSSAASDVYKRQVSTQSTGDFCQWPWASDMGSWGEPLLEWHSNPDAQVYEFPLPHGVLRLTQNTKSDPTMPEGSTDIHFTNGLVVWESAIQLSTYLTEEVTAGRLQLSGKRVLEIGSGPGLVGLVCAALGAEAVLSDYELPVLQLLDYNVRANRAVLQGQARAVKFDWNQPLEDEGMFDFVVATDVLASETNARLVSKVTSN
eukprot:TRINITY_DN2133_c0_g1_i5.p1 TRINITY_DN2133_c0_g1~~TRINITY_DN2133_c0_g1_i5.p1  ORF type:complete len:214 (-),score=58.61 TRINITY_DN2133_c0_g1_i5:124-765(-)